MHPENVQICSITPENCQKNENLKNYFLGFGKWEIIINVNSWGLENEKEIIT